MLSVMLSNQVPKSCISNTVQSILKIIIIIIKICLWVTRSWFSLPSISQFFHIFYTGHILFLPKYYVLEEVEKSIHALSRLPACWHSSRFMVAAECQGWQKSDNKQMVFSYTTCPKVNCTTQNSIDPFLMKPSYQWGIHFPNWMIKSKLWYV